VQTTVFNDEGDVGTPGRDNEGVAVCGEGEASFVRGDANTDGSCDIADAVFILAHLFAEGADPRCLDAADTNDDGAVNLADGIYILQSLFADGPAIPPPRSGCGVDPTVDALGCATYDHCPSLR
jgi:hypothetical protein